MKKQTTYVDGSKIEEIIQALGLPMHPQSGFIKVAGAKGRNVYVARTKAVGRVDLSGFEMPAGTPGIVDLGGEGFGAVKQQVDFTLTEQEVLGTIARVLEYMASLPAREIARKPGAPKKASAKGWSPAVAKPELTQEQKAERAQALRERAALLSSRKDGGAGSAQASL